MTIRMRCSGSAVPKGWTTRFWVAPTSTLRKDILSLEESTAARAAADDSKLRRSKAFHDAAASWDRVGRIIARVEVDDWWMAMATYNLRQAHRKLLRLSRTRSSSQIISVALAAS
jgi:hypothetical protein